MATSIKPIRLTITDPATQLRPALDLRTAMVAAEQLTGASAGGDNTGATTYVDKDGHQIGPCMLLTGTRAKPVQVALLVPGADPASITGVDVPLQSIATSRDLGGLDAFIEQVQAGGDAAVATSLTIGNFQFVADPAILEKQPEATTAQKNLQS